jgi:hypothetical protein
MLSLFFLHDMKNIIYILGLLAIFSVTSCHKRNCKHNNIIKTECDSTTNTKRNHTATRMLHHFTRLRHH